MVTCRYTSGYLLSTHKQWVYLWVPLTHRFLTCGSRWFMGKNLHRSRYVWVLVLEIPVGWVQVNPWVHPCPALNLLPLILLLIFPNPFPQYQLSFKNIAGTHLVSHVLFATSFLMIMTTVSQEGVLWMVDWTFLVSTILCNYSILLLFFILCSVILHRGWSSFCLFILFYFSLLFYVRVFLAGGDLIVLNTCHFSFFYLLYFLFWCFFSH
jgi:hypothetical protein